MAKKNELNWEYDPIKEVPNEQAAAVVWTTNSLNKAVEGIQKGLPLKVNPFIGKNTRLLKPDLVYKRTAAEIEDYIRCKEDPIYFAAKCYLMTPEGLQPVVLRDYQVDYLNHLKNNNFSILLSARQSGKSTTTAIFCLWKILFNTDKKGLILSKSGPAGIDLLNKIKDMFMFLPYHLKCGIMKWNQHEISFDSNSSISTEAFSPTAGLGQTINFLILDEFAWCPPNDVELFYSNIIPTISSISDATICIMSTQNGFNLFYKLWQSAITKKSIYAPFKVDWWQVPQYNPETRKWDKRTDAWKQKMVGVLGSEEAFYYQYGTEFSASDKCLASRECLARLKTNTELFVQLTKEQLENVNFYYKEYLYIKPGYDINNFKEKFYIILVDLAEGGGGDYTVFDIFEMTDEDTFEQVGYWRTNEVSIELASLAFWTMHGNLFNPERVITSIEWNTYGALFYSYLDMLNEPEMKTEYIDRYSMINGKDEFDMSGIVFYKKGSQDEEIAGLNGKKFNKSLVPGIRFSAGNKKTACALLKMMLEKGQITITDILTLSELENFEDKTGSGSYKASFGHDDIIMTFCQIPMLLNTAKYKEFVEEFKIYKTLGSNNTSYSNTDDDFYGGIGGANSNPFAMPSSFDNYYYN